MLNEATLLAGAPASSRVRPAVALLLLAPLAAGCLSSSQADEPPVAVPEPFAMVESVIAADDSGPEPSLGVTPDGILFTDLGSNVYRSDDQGRTWRLMGDPNPTVPNLDPDLAVDADGNVWESRLYVACAEVAVSRDLGETWASNPLVCPLAGGDRQYVVPTRGGEAYIYFHQLPSFYQTVAKTTDYGVTWVPAGSAEDPDHVLLANGGSGWGGGGFWNPVTGSVFFTFSYSKQQGLDNPTAASGAGYAVTRDGGLTWTARQAALLDGQQLGLGLVTGAVDDAGNIALTWGEGLGDDGSDVAIYVATSTDDGQTWSDKVRVDAGNGSKVFPVIAAGQAGRFAVAYYEGSKAAFPDDMDGTWNVTLAYTDDVFAGQPWSHGQLTSQPAKHSPICISGTTCQGDREFADYFDIVRMPDGRVGAAYNILDDGEDGTGAMTNGFALTREPLLGPMPTAGP